MCVTVKQMKVWVKVIPNSKENTVIQKGEYLEVRVSDPPKNNKANLKVIELLKKYYNAEVRLLRGATSRKKLFEIEIKER